MSETVDLYKVLGVSKNCTDVDIKKAYKKLVIKHHPDRGGDHELFEIITNAYNILINSESRETYNNIYKQSMNAGSSYVDLKAQSKGFTDKQNGIASTDDYKSFGDAWDELNKKHGFYEENKDDMVIPKQKADKNFSEMINVRSKFDEEDKPEMLFRPGERFDNNKFQAAFTKANGDPLDIMVKKDIPDAWSGNDMGGYSAFDNLDNLYDDNPDMNNIQGANYGSVEFTRGKTIGIDDMKGIKPADYVDSHNVIEDNYMDTMKKKLMEREIDSKIFDEKKMQDYDKTDTAGYGIFDKLGIAYDETLNISDWDNKDTNKAYQKLLQERNMK